MYRKVAVLVVFSLALQANANSFSKVSSHVINQLGKVQSKLGQAKTSFAKKAKLVFVGSVAVTALCLGGAGCSTDKDDKILQPTAEKAQVVKFGLSYASPILDANVEGAMHAVNQLNMQGGLLGMPVELIAVDNQRDPIFAVQLAKDMITIDGVHVLLGPGFSTLAVEVGPIAQMYGIPMMTTVATNPAVTSAGNNVFMAAFTDDFQGKVMSDVAMDILGAQTAAVFITADDVYSQGLADTFIKNFVERGGEIVVMESYQSGMADFAPQIEALVQAQPHVTFVPGFFPDVPVFIRQAKDEFGVESTFIGGDGWETSSEADFFDIGGEAVNGSYYSTYFSADAPAEELSPEASAFIFSFAAEFGYNPNSLSALAFDAAMLVANAIENANSLDPAAIRLALEQTSNYEGATSITGYDENRHAQKSAVINRMVDGKSEYFTVYKPNQ